MTAHIRGNVAAILDDTTVVINRGMNHGVQRQDIFYIYTELGPFEDPESGEDLGTAQKILGRVTVETVEDRFCIASSAGRTSVISLPTPFATRRSRLPIDESHKRQGGSSLKIRVGSPVYREVKSVNNDDDNGSRSG